MNFNITRLEIERADDSELPELFRRINSHWHAAVWGPTYRQAEVRKWENRLGWIRAEFDVRGLEQPELENPGVQR